jgi:bifunctional UDP-N-acetylglucosamine pyrophosphorylase/glucosamine-1-phosphate N-acetyltransferase
MTNHKAAAIVLAAGLGTRMETDRPKVLHALAGRAMIYWLLDSIAAAGINSVSVVISDGDAGAAVGAAVVPHRTVVQGEQLGTGHAVRCVCDAGDLAADDVLVLFGADPLIRPATLERLLAARRDGAAVVVLGFRPPDPGLYGRLVVGADGTLEAIVEARDATPEQRAIDLCNSGVMVIDGSRLADLVGRLDNNNTKKEYYLTDIVALARGDGLTCTLVEGDAEELVGVDSRADLAVAEAIVQTRLRGDAMAGGATLADPTTVYFSFDTVLGRDVTVGPNVVFGPGVTVSDGAEIRAFSHLEGARVGPDAVVGPFARLRPGADVGSGARVGNFVEVKNAVLDSGAKVNHLSYVGDAHIGAFANVGAGTITCNYDGFSKHRTVIGAGAFIGSNTALVAPVKVGDGASIGAGSVITKDVAADALALTRADHREIEGGAERLRRRKAKDKNKEEG